MLGPGIAWYLGVAAFLFGVGALGVLVRRNPLIVLLSLEIMLNGANLALIAFSRHAHNGAGPDLRARRDGGRRVGGVRRARARRRDPPPPPRARRRPALGAARMIAGAWLCLLAPLARRARDHARRHAHLAPRGRLALDRSASSSPSPAPSWSFFGLRSHGSEHGCDRRPRGRGSQSGSFKVGLDDPRRPAQHDDDADRLRRRRPDRPLLDRLHGRRRRGAPLLRVHVALRLLDAPARRRAATCCCCSSAGGSSASARTC